jgi:anthranilate/para-aminobenzoate synthase component I
MPPVHRLDLTADEIVRGLLKLSETEHVAILDSCGVGHLGSHLLIGGIGTPIHDPALDDLVDSNRPTVFTLSYKLGAKLNGIATRPSTEPEIFALSFDALFVHDYYTGETQIIDNDSNADALLNEISTAAGSFDSGEPTNNLTAHSNFNRRRYIDTVDAIKERIRAGDTYQTNLTQQITVDTGDTKPQDAFWRLRRDHPAPFAAFITRGDSTVVSASPERFFRITNNGGRVDLHDPANFTDYVEPLLTCELLTRTGGRPARRIETSPIKGTRRRGLTRDEDAALRQDLLISPKDRAENTMIVDLLRNDLGRVCEYGSVRVENLCELEEHPTLFHLVSTVSGELRSDATFSDIIRALFPCGSITGAPKISTMRIIDELEPTPRGLSMGAIGYSVPSLMSQVPSPMSGPAPWTWDLGPGTWDSAGLGILDMSVAIRTIVFRDGTATSNVGGGITIDSDPEQEYEESLLKAEALLNALNATLAA